MKKVLIVGDCHVRPGVDISRFTNLGNLVTEKRPDDIVFIGDFMDCSSLNKYEIKLGDMNRSDYVNEVKYNYEALRLFHKPIKDLQELQRRRKKKMYKPKRYITLGNHEDRYNLRIKDGLSWLKTCHSPRKLFELFRFKAYDFLEPMELHGTKYVHYLQNSGSNNACYGTAEYMRKQAGCSLVVGHSHNWDISIFRDLSGSPCNALVAGKFMAKDQKEDYARQSNLRWANNCVTILYVHPNNDWDIEKISLEVLESWYN